MIRKTFIQAWLHGGIRIFNSTNIWDARSAVLCCMYIHWYIQSLFVGGDFGIGISFSFKTTTKSGN